MTNAELIKALRHCGKGGDIAERCLPCGYYDGEPWCEAALVNDAADALEAADKRIDGLQKLVDINTERCEALRKQLREANENYEKHLNELEAQNELTTKCNQLQAEIDNYEKRIAELEAQLPKEGEWIEKWRFKTDGTPFHKIGDMECSVCHGDMLGRYYSKYCPHCGALLRGENDERTDKA